MFAKALKDRKNNSLEVVTVLVFFNPLSTEFWNREVIPILHFKRDVAFKKLGSVSHTRSDLCEL
jgi:hypothetical protein